MQLEKRKDKYKFRTLDVLGNNMEYYKKEMDEKKEYPSICMAVDTLV